MPLSEHGEEPETASERVARVVWFMAFGAALSTQEIARLTGLKPRGALDLMNRIARVLPIYQDDGDIWRICEVKRKASAR